MFTIISDNEFFSKKCVCNKKFNTRWDVCLSQHFCQDTSDRLFLKQTKYIFLKVCTHSYPYLAWSVSNLSYYGTKKIVDHGFCIFIWQSIRIYLHLIWYYSSWLTWLKKVTFFISWSPSGNVRTGVFGYEEVRSDKKWGCELESGWEIKSCGNKPRLAQSGGFSEIET